MITVRRITHLKNCAESLSLKIWTTHVFRVSRFLRSAWIILLLLPYYIPVQICARIRDSSKSSSQVDREVVSKMLNRPDQF